jgi:hypothetical protein
MVDDWRLRYFGAHWDVPMLEGAVRMDTPAGEDCGYCAEPIRLGDQGVLRGEAVLHRECDLRLVLGGVNHLKRRCGCYGGFDDEDPPDLTRRQAARLVLIFTRSSEFQALR